ncbi:PRTRC system protein E [Paraburkholderia agricolaris]|uniref:PRTRC system protein E n=1 Tax=Paraburkholderia agricolaris TaxID=2152888 RepID=A0ABW8ZXE0_9BURK
MFQQLEALVRATGKLQLTLKIDNDQLVVVVMPQGDSKESALCQPLVLKGTAAELDEGFAETIQVYSIARVSLSEQVAATTAILQEAEKKQATKAQKSLAKGGKPAKPAVSGGDADSGEDDDVEDNSPAPTPAPATETQSGTDLFSLLS